jgi:CheY-like chemotaxis protein
MLEDDDSIRNVMKLALEFEGYKVHVAANGQEGLKVLSTISNPNVILLDLMMPVMNGWEFADALGKNLEYARIPIIVVTAFAEKAKNSIRAAAVIKKPVDLNSLYETVRYFCEEPYRNMAK